MRDLCAANTPNRPDEQSIDAAQLILLIQIAGKAGGYPTERRPRTPRRKSAMVRKLASSNSV